METVEREMVEQIREDMFEVARREAAHTRHTKALQARLQKRSKPQEVAPMWVLWTYVTLYQSQGVEWGAI